jgi:diguanylate cyclase (GGDEF)-like protein/PAS domain S-box-containing protein
MNDVFPGDFGQGHLASPEKSNGNGFGAQRDWQALLRTAIESSSQGLCIFDRQLRLVIANEHHRSIYGLAPAQTLVGRRIEEILPRRLAGVSNSGAAAVHQAEYLGAVERREAFRATYELRGDTFVEIDMHPMPDGGLVERHRDITDLRLAEIRAEQARQELIEKQYALDQAVIVAVTDLRGTITYANDRFCEISGYSRAELLGSNHRILNSGMHSRQFFREMYRCLARGKVWRGELRNKSKSGSFYWVDTVITPQLGPEGKPISYMAIRIDITARKNAEAQIHYAAKHDALTGLLNRAVLREGLAERLERRQRDGGTLIVYMIDLDGFKHVNDTLGHAAGDLVLKDVAKRLERLASNGDLVARLGGDEFAIVQTSAAEAREQAIGLACKLLDVMAEPFTIDTQEASIGVSIGISLAPADGLVATELMHKADLALYRVKAEGRNGFLFFEEQMKERAQSRNRFVNELRTALTRDEFELHYQPMFDAKTLRAVGMEALVRWRHPSAGLLYPDEFIGVAEQAGLMQRLGRWILQRACADAVSWPEDVKVAVNLSAVQFRGATLFETILAVLLQTGLSPQRLELELTESLVLQKEDENILLFRQLRNIGISMALDDFGVGYASLGSLVSFPFDKVKIDKSFTQNLVTRSANRAVVASIMTLARGLKLDVTAEGVETQEQLEYLRNQGVHELQGYLLGKPRPPQDLEFGNSADNPHSGDKLAKSNV